MISRTPKYSHSSVVVIYWLGMQPKNRALA